MQISEIRGNRDETCGRLDLPVDDAMIDFGTLPLLESIRRPLTIQNINAPLPPNIQSIEIRGSADYRIAQKIPREAMHFSRILC
ncbi:MAG: hypothetical protein VYA34_07600 [Myxococcota bacterium]|nr:hypothetical protein [Myxococcota bacterium]